MEKSGLVYAVLQTGRTTPVPGDGEIRHRDLLWRIESRYLFEYII